MSGDVRLGFHSPWVGTSDQKLLNLLELDEAFGSPVQDRNEVVGFEHRQAQVGVEEALEAAPADLLLPRLAVGLEALDLGEEGDTLGLHRFVNLLSCLLSKGLIAALAATGRPGLA